MELKKLTIAVAGALFSLNVYAASEPVPQYVDRSVLHDHEHHGVEDHQPDNAPKKTLTQKPEPTFKMFSAAADEAAVTCDVETFATSNSTALISAITTQGASCVNKLFSAESRVQETAFESSNMFNVAKHTVNIAKTYQGGGSDELEALFLFLRAGYYAEFYNNNVSFLSWVTPAVKEAVDAFVANANFYESSDAHGKVLREVIITMDSASLEHAYLDVITQWLNRWNSDYAQHWYMRDAVNGVFTVLFGGQWNDQYVQAIGSQIALVDALAKMALNRDSITRADEFMTLTRVVKWQDYLSTVALRLKRK